MTSQKPVLYLDVDDTLLSSHESYFKEGMEFRHYGFAPQGGRDVLLWFLENFEVRWLSWWCASGEMLPERSAQIEDVFGLPRGSLADIPAVCFSETTPMWKTNGINWQEHLAGRPFVWVEDWLSEKEQKVLSSRGFLDSWIPCHTTEDPYRLLEVQKILSERFGYKIESAG